MTDTSSVARANRLVLTLTAASAAAVIGLSFARVALEPQLLYRALESRVDMVVAETSPLSTLAPDIVKLAACLIVLVTCASFFRARACSRFGGHLANLVALGTVSFAASSLVALGLEVLRETVLPSQVFVRTAAGAVATISFCAFLTALVGVPAAAAIAARYESASWREHSWRKKRLRHVPAAGPSSDPAPAMTKLRPPPVVSEGESERVVDADFSWWNAVLRKPSLPQPSIADRAAKELVPEDADDDVRRAALVRAVQEQQSWLASFNVPNANEKVANTELRPVQALCLSGGGVRSACVATGAMQVFSESASLRPNGTGKLIDDVDYVISVSGGGYAAGARVMAVQPEPGKPGEPRPANQPTTIELARRYEPGSAEMDYFRRGSSYIADSPASLMRALAEVLKNLVASLITIFTIPVIVGWVSGYLLARFPIAAFPPIPQAPPSADRPAPFPALMTHTVSYWALAALAAIAMILLLMALITEWRWTKVDKATLQGRFLTWAGVVTGFALVVLAMTVVLPALMRLCWMADHHAPVTPGGTIAALSGVVGLNYVAALAAMAWRHRGRLAPPNQNDGGGSSRLKRLLPPAVLSMLLIVATLAALSVVWLALLGSFAAGVFGYNTRSYGGTLTPVPHWQWWIIGLVATAAFVGFADVTSLSLHPFYRRRLAHTFAVRRHPSEGTPNRAMRYADGEPTVLSTYGRVDGGPTFVFACSATITGPGKPAPGLNAVSYVLSADLVGGPELGWFDTKELIAASPPRIRRDLTVQAAVAISGAAFASAMGRMDRGIEKLLAVSGARLGTWLPNPWFVTKLAEAHEASSSMSVGAAAGVAVASGQSDAAQPGGDDPAADADLMSPAAAVIVDRVAAGGERSADDVRSVVWPPSLPTVRGAGYLYREVLGINNKAGRLVQVTDGGHYDNSGLVEAMRRRCRLIICIDGGGDTPPLATGLADALRLAEYELGVTVQFEESAAGDDRAAASRYLLQDIAPGTGRQFGERDALRELNTRISRHCVAVGTIIYPVAAGLSDNRGILIYGKAVLAEECPYWLKVYSANNPIFPHDPTSDQWFSEAQFAAYTELGRVIGREVVQCADRLRAWTSNGPSEVGRAEPN